MRLWNRDGFQANIHLVKIYFLFLKLFIRKEISCLRVKFFH